MKKRIKIKKTKSQKEEVERSNKKKSSVNNIKNTENKQTSTITFVKANTITNTNENKTKIPAKMNTINFNEENNLILNSSKKNQMIKLIL